MNTRDGTTLNCGNNLQPIYKISVAACINDKILCLHGGLSPELNRLEQFNEIIRPTEVPDQGLLYDILWADPDKDADGLVDSDRGMS